MKTTLLAIVLLTLAPGLPAPAPAAPPDETPFVLGVLRRDGVVLPFAAFDGKNWQARWPESLWNVELPLTLADIPSRWWGRAERPSEWTVWSGGAPRGTIKPLKTVMMTAACARRIGLATDYTATEPLPPPSERPYPKDGLVTSGPQRIEALQALNASSPEWNAVANTSEFIEAFDKSEQRAIEWYTEWHHPLSRKERNRLPIELEAVYRAPMDDEGWVAYHVEAVRRYPPGKADEGCGLVTSFSGWMGAGPEGRRWVQSGASVTYCDRKGVSYFLPLGLMHLRDRTYWIFQMAGYDGERYYVGHPTKREPEIATGYTAGTCGGY